MPVRPSLLIADGQRLAVSIAAISKAMADASPCFGFDAIAARRFDLLRDDAFAKIQEESRNQLDSIQEHGASHAVQQELSKPILETRKALPAVVRLLFGLRGAKPSLGRFYCATMSLAAIWHFKQSLPSQLLFMTDAQEAADTAIGDQLTQLDDQLDVLDALEYMLPWAEKLCTLTQPDAALLCSLRNSQRSVDALTERLSAARAAAAAAAAQLHAELMRQHASGSSNLDHQVGICSTSMAACFPTAQSGKYCARVLTSGVHCRRLLLIQVSWRSSMRSYPGWKGS